MPNGSQLQATKAGTIPLHPTLSQQATTTHIVPGLNSSSLISLGQLCDDGWNVLLTDTALYAVKNNKVVMRGICNPIDRPWDIPLTVLTK